ncbi:MAG TPA: YraN family protein [Candidatus Cybelea sp.]|nr:YraN family protein [Candidatus Cybelea sp.]
MSARKPRPGRTESGRQAFHRGHGAERRAAWWLRLKGYRVLAINWRSVVGEIDLIARRGTTLAIVEVKQRIDHDAATLALTPTQIRRLARAAELYIAQHPRVIGLTLRFDLVTFGRMGRPIHMKDAWRPESPWA